MSVIGDFASNSVMGVVRKIVNHITGNIDPTLSDAVDHLPSRFHGTFDDTTRNLQLTIESQGTSTEDLVATVNIPGGGGSGGPTYTAGNGINITSANAIEIDPNITATVAEVDTKVAKNQGTANAGKVLGIGSDGMVTPVNDGSSGTWHEMEIAINQQINIPEALAYKVKFNGIISNIIEKISGTNEQVSSNNIDNLNNGFTYNIVSIRKLNDAWDMGISPIRNGTTNTSFVITIWLQFRWNYSTNKYALLGLGDDNIISCTDNGQTISMLSSKAPTIEIKTDTPLILYYFV